MSLATRTIDVFVSDMVLTFGDAGGLADDCAARGIPTLTLSGNRIRPGQSAAERPVALLQKPFRFGDLQSVLDAVAREPGFG